MVLFLILSLFLAVTSIVVHPPVVSDDTIVLSWINPYPDCVNVEYEYQFYRESDGQLVTSGIIMKNELTLSELECDTRYRLRLRDKMNKMIGTDNYISVQTNAQCEYEIKSQRSFFYRPEVQVANEI